MPELEDSGDDRGRVDAVHGASLKVRPHPFRDANPHARHVATRN